jgi:hypothetical protein
MDAPCPKVEEHAAAVGALLAQHVPEVLNGAVRVRGVARQAGVRTKVVVESTVSTLDPVEVVVGEAGARARALVQALDGEPIDIIPWHAAPSTLATYALAPHRVLHIGLDEASREMTFVLAEQEPALPVQLHVCLAASLLNDWTLAVIPLQPFQARGWEAPPSFTAPARADRSGRKEAR